LDNIRGICTKTGLAHSLRSYYQHTKEAFSARYTVNDSTPTTFVVSSMCTDSEYKAFEQRFKELESGNFSKETLAEKHCKENVWLVKPAAQNQGTFYSC